MKHPDLARGAVVHQRAVEDREHRVGALDRRPVLRENPRCCDVKVRRELVLVRNEDLEAVGTQRAGALVDERAFVRREERTGEVDPQGVDATPCKLTRIADRPTVAHRPPPPERDRHWGAWRCPRGQLRISTMSSSASVWSRPTRWASNFADGPVTRAPVHDS